VGPKARRSIGSGPRRRRDYRRWNWSRFKWRERSKWLGTPGASTSSNHSSRQGRGAHYRGTNSRHIERTAPNRRGEWLGLVQ
jgi:hypothetical protein